MTYDAGGNALSDGSYTYAWDGDNRMKSAAGVNYTYDAFGNRVQKSNGKTYWYGANDQTSRLAFSHMHLPSHRAERELPLR